MKKEQRSPAELAQSAVIGALLLDAKSCEGIFGMLSPCMFPDGPYRTAFECMVMLHGAGKPIDIVTALGYLGEKYQRFLTACAEVAPGVSSAAAYAQIVCDEWRKAELYQKMVTAEADCLTPGCSADDIVTQLRSLVAAQDEIASAGDVLREGAFAACVDRFLAQYGKKDEAICCGWQELDNRRYLCPGRVTVLAARPGSGKTDFALAWALKLAVRVPVMFFSLELNNDELFNRIVSNVIRVDCELVQSGRLTAAQRVSMDNLLGLLKKQATLIFPEVEKINGSMLDFIEGCIRTQKPAVVFVDHIGIVTAGDSRMTDYARISLITRSLKLIARRYGAAIVELCQLNRAVDRNKGGQGSAVLADLRGSGTIEQDADAVLFVRPEAREETMRGNMFCGVDIACVKNRHGPRLTHRFDWFPQHSRYIPVDVHNDDFVTLPDDEDAPEQQTFSPQKKE